MTKDPMSREVKVAVQPRLFSKPADAGMGDYVEFRSIAGGAKTTEVTLQCRLNPNDLWTFTQCHFVKARLPKNLIRETEMAWRRVG